MPRLTQENNDKAIHMMDQGATQAVVAGHFHIHPSTIARLRQRFHITERVADQPRHCAPPVTSTAQDRHIQLQPLHNMFQAAEATPRGTIGTRQLQISP